MPSSYGSAPVDQSVTLGAGFHGERHNEIWTFVDNIVLNAVGTANLLGYNDTALRVGATQTQHAIEGVSARSDATLAEHARTSHGAHGILDFSKVSASYKRSATADRPTAASVGVGGQWFDVTVNRPIWSNGASWVYADGTAA
jgi:hypothetical protein